MFSVTVVIQFGLFFEFFFSFPFCFHYWFQLAYCIFFFNFSLIFREKNFFSFFCSWIFWCVSVNCGRKINRKWRISIIFSVHFRIWAVERINSSDFRSNWQKKYIFYLFFPSWMQYCDWSTDSNQSQTTSVTIVSLRTVVCHRTDDIGRCTSWRQTIVMCFVCMSHSMSVYAATGNSKTKCETKTKRRREKAAPHLVACHFDLYEIFFVVVVVVAQCYCGLSAIITSSNGHYYKNYLSSYDRCVCSNSFCVNKSWHCRKANDGNGNRRLGRILNSYSLL